VSQAPILRRVTRNLSGILVILLAGVWLVTALGAVAQDDSVDASVDQNYRLGAGDKLQVDVFNQADLTGQYTLDGSGRFTMHLIGSVTAAGLTASELESLLVNRLKPDYLVNPRVSVQVLSYRPFYIIGEVSRPNSYAYVDGMTYLTAIAIAGGYTYRAKKDVVFVVRADDPERNELKLDVKERVQPGDIIRVDERLF
jgi:polysaccharide export outer membrane protein